ncbi:MAG TPA: Sec-independent protein translocase protein TatB [Candidatus Mailhella merdavium]|nr:Sec-independent protein translocase protein TatB [Candidatus Mailhella merdavium]
MFGIGSTELLVILVVALLVLGPRNLPKIAQTLGRAMGEFRKVSTDFQRTLNTEIAFEEEKDKQRKKEQAKEGKEEAKSPSEHAAASEERPTASADTKKEEQA